MRLKFRLSNGKKTFFQWDVNQKIILENPICTQVHFENKDISDKAYVKEVYKDNEGRSVVDIPDIFLQYTPGFLFYGYVISEDGKERFTEERGDVSVIRRAKPSDYVFTPEDQKTLEEVFDDAVKYIPEKKTDEEKANARENIGAESVKNKVSEIGDDDGTHYPTVGAVKAELDKKIDNPQAASIGEVLTVEEVDENGKPTKWKTAPAAAEQVQSDLGQNDETAADFVKNRTHYDSRVIKTIEKTFENITETKPVKLADADIDINRIVSYSMSGTDGENTYNIIVTNILIDDVSEFFDKPTGSVFNIRSNDGHGPTLDYFAVPVEIPNQSDDGSEATVTYHGLYSMVNAGYILVKFEINIESGELKKLDKKYIPEIDPSKIKDMYYTAVEEIDLAGYTLTNVNYKGDHDVYPFELGQVWNATGRNINFTNLKVKQADDGTLYIGDLNKSNPPFFISTTSGGAKPQWLDMANPGSMNLVGVSGKVTTEIIHKIYDKYIPDSIAYKDQLPAMAIMELAVSNTVMITDININDAYDSALVIVKTNNSEVPSLTDVLINYKNNTYYKRIISALTDSEIKSADIPYVIFLYIDMNNYGATWLLNPVVATTEKMDVIIPSNSHGSTKKFKITVDDSGTLSAAEVNT